MALSGRGKSFLLIGILAIPAAVVAWAFLNLPKVCSCTSYDVLLLPRYQCNRDMSGSDWVGAEGALTPSLEFKRVVHSFSGPLDSKQKADIEGRLRNWMMKEDGRIGKRRNRAFAWHRYGNNWLCSDNSEIWVDPKEPGGGHVQTIGYLVVGKTYCLVRLTDVVGRTPDTKPEPPEDLVARVSEAYR